MLKTLLEFAPALLWCLLWSVGGIWICLFSFNLRHNESILAGLGCGLIMQIWLARWIALFIAPLIAFWVSAILVFLAGALPLLFSRRRPQSMLKSIVAHPVDWVLLFCLLYIFFNIERSLALFDDATALPATSLLAAGFFPRPIPFASLKFFSGNQFFLSIFAAELQRLFNLFPWNALDAGRTLSIVLGILLAGIWTRRLTNHLAAGCLGSLFAAFGMGSRWLLLVLPPEWLQALSNAFASPSPAMPIPYINLKTALTSIWDLPGSGPLSFPFAFASGIHLPGVMAHEANGLMGLVIILCLLLTATRWQNRWAGLLVSMVLLSSLSMIDPLALGFFCVAFLLVFIFRLLNQKHLSLADPITLWGLVVLVTSLVTLIQSNSIPLDSFTLSWPVLISPRLGNLPLLNGSKLLVALAELGPAILALPLVVIWGHKAYRSRHWFEAALVLSALLSLVTLFIQPVSYKTEIHPYVFVEITLLYAVPLVWIWVTRRSEQVKIGAAILGTATILGGVLLFGIELIASPNQQMPTYLNSLDAQVFEDFWNRFDQSARIFDWLPARSETIFGRTAENLDSGTLISDPTPQNIRKVGYDYIYMDDYFWNDLDKAHRASFEDLCVHLVKDYKPKRGNEFRRLLEIQTCR